MKKTNQRRQGDVLIEKINTKRSGGKKQNHCVLAVGEATGHNHSVLDRGAASLYEEALGADAVLEVETPTEVKHQKHAAIPVDEGTWRITRQREYVHGSERRVAD